MSTLSTLPLQIRVGLRDSFEAPDAPVNEALKKLNETTGYDMTLEIAWIDIWRDLQPKFDDKATFVPTVTQAVALFLQPLDLLLTLPSAARPSPHRVAEAFQEAFLTKMEGIRKPSLFRGEMMTLFLPVEGPEGLRSISSSIGADIEKVFTGKAQNTTQSNKETTDDFEVLPKSPTIKATSRVLSLPQLDTLPRPETLFASLLPYTIIVRRTGNGIDIEGSHQPTLELICEYFKKHARKNLNDTRQVLYSIDPSYVSPGI
ncbi:hypothetical protein PIIN_02979 [Serendipita indica DSM 11827]|uniref:Uncharacterized protein n=1 Tax=Serendipita indica (strain DSM 11827) TaxID=1109443 RepID=G4U2D6_SERID|nr:hypothetical protein PIIN_02979 [Serendipita indica DSM 11827]